MTKAQEMCKIAKENENHEFKKYYKIILGWIEEVAKTGLTHFTSDDFYSHTYESVQQSYLSYYLKPEVIKMLENDGFKVFIGSKTDYKKKKKWFEGKWGFGEWKEVEEEIKLNTYMISFCCEDNK